MGDEHSSSLFFSKEATLIPNLYWKKRCNQILCRGEGLSQLG